MGNVHRQMQLGFLVMAIGLGLQLLTMLLIAAHLGPGIFGVYAVIMGIANIANFITSLGVGTVLTKLVAEARQLPSYYVALALPLVGGFSVASGLLLIAITCVAYTVPVAGGAALLAAGNIFFFGISTVFSAVLRGLGQIEKWMFWFLAQKAVAFATVIALLRPLDGGLTLAMSTWTIANLVLLFYAAGALWGDAWRGQLRWSLKEVRSLAGESVSVATIAAITRFGLELENFILAILMPAHVVGLYAAGRRIIDPAGNILNGAVSVPTFPGLCRLVRENRREFNRWTTQLCLIQWVSSLAVALVVCAVAPFAIRLVLDAEFEETSQVVQIIVWSLAPAMLSNQLRYTFIALSRERRFLALSICYLVIKVFILVIFISRFGIWGACYGAVLAELVLVIMVRIGTGALDIPLRFPQRGVVATIVAALGMVLVWWAADTNWLLMVLGVSFGLLAAHVVNRLARSVRGPRGDRPDG